MHWAVSINKIIKEGVIVKNQLFLCLIVLSLVIGCSSDTVDHVYLYEMESFSETKMGSLKVINESKDIDIFLAAISGSIKNAGISDMIDPHYKVELGEETYFLWIYKDSGTVMNLNDTHTTYSLTKKSVKEVNEVIKTHFSD